MDKEQERRITQLLIDMDQKIGAFGARSIALEGSLIELTVMLSQGEQFHAGRYVNGLRRIAVFQTEFDMREHQQRIAREIEEALLLANEKPQGDSDEAGYGQFRRSPPPGT